MRIAHPTSSTTMGGLNKCLLIMVFVVQVGPCVFATSIDSIIAEAANSSREFEFFYDMDSGDVKVEMDMLYSREQWNAIQNAIAAERSGSVRREAIKEGAGGHRWSSRLVPYEIAPHTFSPSEVSQIEAALHDWSRYTCLTFRRANSTDKNRVRFQNGGGCFSRVGMVGGTQEVGLAPGCRIKRIVIHEVGHALGLNHEQTRPDRDSYVTIIRGNIASSMYFNFQKYTWTIIENFHIPYDYYSIMHYGKTAFSINGGITIKTSDVQYQDVIGNQSGLSFRDIKTMNRMYPCVRAAKCTKRDSDCPGEGFVGKDCKCWCPGSPYKVCNGTGHGGGGSGGGGAGTGAGGGTGEIVLTAMSTVLHGRNLENVRRTLPTCCPTAGSLVTIVAAREGQREASLPIQLTSHNVKTLRATVGRGPPLASARRTQTTCYVTANGPVTRVTRPLRHRQQRVTTLTPPTTAACGLPKGSAVGTPATCCSTASCRATPVNPRREGCPRVGTGTRPATAPPGLTSASVHPIRATWRLSAPNPVTHAQGNGRNRRN